jgi:chemotaxis protein CheX
MDTEELKSIAIEAVTSSVDDLFETMLACRVTCGEATADDTCIKKDITGMIGIAGEYKGAINVYFPEPVALKCVSAMMGMDVTAIDDDTRDAVGEITNMIVGGAKNYLYEKSIKCDISTPIVVVGQDYRVYAAAGTDKTVIPFESAYGAFYVDFFLRAKD